MRNQPPHYRRAPGDEVLTPAEHDDIEFELSLDGEDRVRWVTDAHPRAGETGALKVVLTRA